MLKKENRLQKERDFSKVFKGSRPIHTANLIFRVSKQSQISNLKSQNYGARFGFVISNKINKLATGRNALKRQLREIIHQNIQNIKLGYNIIIIVKSDFQKPYNQSEIKLQVLEGVKKAGVFQGGQSQISNLKSQTE